MRRRTRRIALGVLLLPVVLLSLYAAAEPKTLRSHLVGFSDMRGEGEQLYVDPAWDTSTVRWSRLECVSSCCSGRRHGPGPS